jgi:pyridoxine/pyridoxamine 5'-phosphate oxidase
VVITRKEFEMHEQNLDIYGHEPIPWSRALKQLEAQAKEEGRGRTCWLATTDPDGRPHVAAVGAVWVDGKFYFVSGPRLRKSRNVAANPRCAVSVSLDDIDVVVEGTARKVTDMAVLERIANLYASLGWPAHAIDGAIMAEYSAPSAGRGPWNLYAVTPTAAVGVATAEPHGATRWNFER